VEAISEKIHVLGISGSPRKGNSEFLLDVALNAAHGANPDLVETELYSIRGKKIAPCIACFKCSEDANFGECCISDDFQGLRQRWINSDVIIYSIPVYHLHIPGQLKCFFDRLGNTINKYYKLPNVRFLKVVGGIAQGSHFFAGQESAINYLLSHAVLRNCIPVSGDGWQSYLGACGWTICKTDKDAIKTQFEQGILDAELVVEASRSLGRRAVELSMLLRYGGIHLRDFLSKDPTYSPFIERLPNH
jgi:multimeric flavodoxin WrbA